MARSDVVARVKDIVYGQGVNQRPVLVQCAANANEVISAPTVTFDLATGAGAGIKAGHTLSVYGSADDTESHAMFVLSVSTDTVTAANGYLGSPAVAASSLDSKLLEVNPFQVEHQIHKRIDAIVDGYLWDQIYKISTASVTPDLTDGQVEVPATVERITGAQQYVGSEWVAIPYGIVKNVNTAVSSTGTMGIFDAINGSTVYYTYMEKVAVADGDTDESLNELIALGTAALLLGASTTETGHESEVQRYGQPASVLWRDFITLRQSYGEKLAQDTVLGFEYDRG